MPKSTEINRHSYRRLQIRVFFRQNLILLFCGQILLIGCRPAAVIQPQSMSNITAGEAKNSLLRLLNGKITPEHEIAAWPEIAQVLQSAKEIDRLKNSETESEGSLTFIGGWTFELGKNRFFRSVFQGDGTACEVEGVFHHRSDGTWEAAVTGFTFIRKS